MKFLGKLRDKVSSIVFKDGDKKKYGEPKYVMGQIVSVLDDDGLEIIGKIARIEFNSLVDPRVRHSPGWDYVVEIVKGKDHYGWIAEEELRPAHKKKYSIGDVFISDDGKLVKVCRYYSPGCLHCKGCVYKSFFVRGSDFHTSCLAGRRTDGKNVYYKEIRESEK